MNQLQFSFIVGSLRRDSYSLKLANTIVKLKPNFIISYAK